MRNEKDFFKWSFGLRFLFVSLCALMCIGNAWGLDYTYTYGKAVAVCLDSPAPTAGSFGKVCIRAMGNSGISSVTMADTVSTVSWNTDSVAQVKVSKSTKKWYAYYAQEFEGYEFLGWYKDAACTILADTSYRTSKGIMYDCSYPTSHAYVLQFNGQLTYARDNIAVNGYPNNKITTGTDPGASEYTPYILYAKFQKMSTPKYNYQPQLTITSSDWAKGQIKGSKTEAPSDISLDTIKTYSYTFSNSEEESASGLFYVIARPMRGYAFDNWRKTSSRVSSEDEDAANNRSTSFVVTLDKDMPQTNGTIINQDTVYANFKADSPKRFKIQKEAGAGTVSGTYTYYYATYAGTGNKKYVNGSTNTTKALESLSLSETEHVGVRQKANNETATTADTLFYASDKITLTATPADGYVFSGWYVRQNMKPDSLIPGNNPVLETYLFADSLTFVPVFAPDKNNLDVDGEKDNFLVGLSTCQTFDQALAAAIQGTHKTILQLRNYTVPAGNYTIPEGVTLLIPYNDKQFNPATVLPRLSGNATHSSNNDAYVTLTLDSAAHLEVYGTIEVSGQQAAGVSGAGGEDGIGCPTGTYGCLYMGKGSSITLNDGALLRGWGFVLGDKDANGYQCEIDARRGSRVQEQFQLMDWKGGTFTEAMFGDINSGTNGYKVLPVNQYYIQNVEVPVKYRPGAKLQANSSVYLDTEMGGFHIKQIFNIDNVGIIGVKYAPGTGLKSDASIFLMDDKDDSEDTWVRKYYDPDTDQQVYEVNNAAYLGSLQLNVLGLNVTSTEYKLPITSNFKIHLLYGHMEVTQMTELLPGAEIEINKKATLTQPTDSTLYLWDSEDWDHFVSATRGSSSNFTFRNGTTVKWRPGGRPTVRRVGGNDANDVALSDAKLIVHGTVDVKGYIKTSAHGASITSTVEDAGTIIFTKPAPTDEEAGYIYQIYKTNAANNCADFYKAATTAGSVYKRVGVTSAQLTNASGDPVPTAGDGINTNPISYCFIDINDNGGEWLSLTPVYDPISKCYPLVKDQHDNYYAKPQEYVKLQSGTEDENTHLYYSEDGSRMFILIPEDCQWWEVETVPNHPELFHCKHPLNDTYYYWDDAWVEKLFQITFKNYDGTTLTYGDDDKDYYELPYGATPQWLSANPTRPADEGYYTYDFAGWKPTPAPVTDDAVYTAQYDRTPVLYAISFNYAKNAKNYTDVTYSQRDSMPVCEHYTLAENEKWDPVLSPVTGPATYSVVAKTSQSDYTIIWKNWDGTTLHEHTFGASDPKTKADVEAEYANNAEIKTPTKPILGDTKFTFAGWYPEVQAATEDKVYVALFDEADNDIEVGGTPITINIDSVVSTVTIHNNGVLTIDANKKLTVTNLILEADVDPVTPTNEASGQLYAANSTQVTVDYAYYDLKLNVAGHHWRAFGVPWQVNIDATPLKEVKTQAGDPSDRTLVLGRDYDIVYYNGAKRASSGPGYWCWEFVENHEHVLQPGQGYMIQFVAPVGTVRFAKATGAPILYNAASLPDILDTGDPTNPNANWNGIANPMTYHTLLDAGTTLLVQVHDGGEIGHDGYKNANADGKYVVGKMVFFQAPTALSEVAISKAGSEDAITPFASAPIRRTAEKKVTLNDFYHVELLNAQGVKNADIYVRPEEDKQDTYFIGKDVVSMGLNASHAQMWVNRYGVKLCMNTTALINEETAEFPMGVYAPTAGEYTISLNAQPSDEYNVYLTRDGQAIWNLSDGAFTTDLKAGIQSNYGLRLTVNKAPQVVTGVDEAVVDAKGETKKVLINNQVFIIRGEQVYSIDGQIVK